MAATCHLLMLNFGVITYLSSMHYTYSIFAVYFGWFNTGHCCFASLISFIGWPAFVLGCDHPSLLLFSGSQCPFHLCCYTSHWDQFLQPPNSLIYFIVLLDFVTSEKNWASISVLDRHVEAVPYQPCCDLNPLLFLRFVSVHLPHFYYSYC